MKKLLLLFAVVAAFSFASCKKDRVCTCTSTHNGVTDPIPSVTTYTKSTKGAARANCLSFTSTDNGVAIVTTCSLK